MVGRYQFTLINSATLKEKRWRYAEQKCDRRV